jgi:segregation and condensation protein B
MNDDDRSAEAEPTPTGDIGDLAEVKRVLEAALLVAGEAIPAVHLARLFDPPLDGETVRKLLAELKSDWAGRKVELVQVASGWRFQASQTLQPFLDRLSPEKPPKYSRAVMETLAIIAYQQPVTRGDIEAIRGVAVSTYVVKTLEDRQWVEVVGHRETPGRPALYATTKSFLDDLGLRSLAELPPLAELALALATPIIVGADAPDEPASAPVQPGDAGVRGESSSPETQTFH